MKRRSRKNSNTANLLLIAALVLVVVVFVFAPTGQFFAADYTIDNGDYILELTPSITAANYILTLHGEETFTQTIPLSKISSADYDLTPIASLDGDQDGVLDYAMEGGELRTLDQCPDTEYIARPTHDAAGNQIQYTSNDPLTIPNKAGVNEEGCVPGYLDNDNDGVINDDDQCPQTPATETADSTGCSVSQIDTDSDGVNDLADLCPNTPANTNIYQDAARLGCSQAQALADSDSDGIFDSADQCPNTPMIQKQNSDGDLLVDATGTPIMVPNSIDLSYSTTNPDTGCATGETPLAPGAPDDEDNDGISNSQDLCPNTPAADASLVYTSGNRMGCVDSQLVDADSDGIYDSKDQCPITTAGATVNSVGCADSDGDGIIDPNDSCPATPAGSTVDSTGCATSQTDIDGDGVLNENDICPNTPVTETANSEGCSESQRDIDGDTVIDSADQCPTEDATGYDNDSDGCIDDTDQDSVYDPDDQCPNTPEDSQDIVYKSGNRMGCVDTQLIDTDGDGIYDSADQCTTTPMIQQADEDGNPIMVPNNIFESYSTTNPDTGCAPGEATDLDLDNDGVPNTSDLCPDTPADTNIYQDAARLGCSQLQALADEDSDGIYDSADQCAATLTGATIDAVGCSDTDQDGVVDPLDLCPGTQSDTDGNVLPVNAQGCSANVADTDQDGVLDTADQCPNTAAGATVDSLGCGTAQIDTDQDGVLDPNDSCPNTPTNEQADSGGCSDSQMPVAGIQLSAEVYDVNDLVSGVLANLPKTVDKVYWFDGVKDTTYQIFDDAPNQRTLCKASATKYCTLGSATYSTLAFGEDCSCSTFTDDIPETFKIYNNHVTQSTNFVTVYRSANDCPAEGCSVHAYVMYTDGTTDLFEAKAVLSTTGTPASAPKPYGVNSQDCALGGQQILNTNWCCATGYIADPDLTDVSLTGGDPNACKPYTNQAPTATFISSSNNISLGDTVTFDASESTDSDGTIIEYLWDFGDGTTGTGLTTNHTYSTACTVTPCAVTLTVKDNFNQASTETEVIEIELLALPADTTAEIEEAVADPAADALAQQQAELERERQALAQQQQQIQQQQLAEQQAADASGGGMGWLIALIVLALLGVGGWFAYKRFGKKKPPTSSPASPAQPAAAPATAPAQPAASPIRKFISTQKGQGLSNEQIRSKLRGKGWRDGDIDRYMNAART
tara:strand:+ start:612 stop:4175 length:3564 start_codon:yes stop_codon:yes gene_type:complete